MFNEYKLKKVYILFDLTVKSPSIRLVVCPITPCTWFFELSMSVCFFFVNNNVVCLHSILYCFDSGVIWETQVSSSVTIRLKRSLPSFSFDDKHWSALPWRFSLCTSMRIFGTQCAHYFIDINKIKNCILNLILLIQFHEEENEKIWRKCIDNGVMVNLPFS